jgi:acetyl-CoA acetyltransferase
MIFDPLTKLQCCPTSDGAAAANVCSESLVKKHGLHAKAEEIAGRAMTTDLESPFSRSSIKLIGWDMSKSAALKVFELSGVGPENVDVVELHD